jgi:fatty acid-binding protein DegV
MSNPQYYLICKQETRILVVLPISSKLSPYYSKRKILEQILAPKPSRAKEWMQDGQERERDVVKIK